MAGLRKGHCYTTIKRAYTRKSKFKKKGYIKATPNSKIIRFHMGDTTKKYDRKLELKTKAAIQIRHNALESVRMLVNRRLHEALGLDYHLMVKPYPHHALRENKMLTGAGADRMQTGMQRAFGKVIGLAAQLKKNQTIMSVEVNEKNLDIAMKALKLAPQRLPGKCTITVSKIAK